MTEKEKRLKGLVLEHPMWGRRKLAKELRKEFTTAFRMTTIRDIKQETLLAAKLPIEKRLGYKSLDTLLKQEVLTPAISAKEKETKVIHIGFDKAYQLLRSAGFLDAEIRRIFGAANAPLLFNTKPFKAMLTERRRMIKGFREQKLTPAEIIQRLENWYGIHGERLRDKYTAVFEWLRKHYKPRRKVDFVTYKRAAAKRRKVIAGERPYERAKRERAIRRTKPLTRLARGR